MTRTSLMWLALIAATTAGCKPRTLTPESPVASDQPAQVPRVASGTDRTALPTATIPRVDATGFAADGILNEPLWTTAGTLEAFVAPGDGRYVADSPVNASARVAWDDRALYLAFTVADTAPAAPFGRTDVDPHLWEQSSAVEIMLQPGDPGDNRHYYEVQVDTAGAVWDTRFDDYNRPVEGEGAARTFGHQAWDAQLERGAAVLSDGYIVEVALPWATLASDRTPVPPRTGDTWRANFYSFRDGQRQALAWSPILGEGNFHRSARFGRLTFGP